MLADHAWNPNLVPALHETRYNSAHLWPRIAEVRNNSRKSPSAAWKVQDQHYNMRDFQKQAKLYSQGNGPAAPLFHHDNSEENVMHPYMRLSSQHGHLLSVCLTVSVHTSVSEKKKRTSRQLQISWDFMVVTKVWTELGSENTSILLFLCDTNKGLSSKLQFLPPSPPYCLLYQCCFSASIPESNEIALSRFSTYCLHLYVPLPWG